MTSSIHSRMHRLLAVFLSVAFIFGAVSVAEATDPPPPPPPDDKKDYPHKPPVPFEGEFEGEEEPPEHPRQVEKPKKPYTHTLPPKPIYPVHTKANFCPHGLQPVTVSGAISCGTPTTATSYRHMMMHPTTHRKRRSAVPYGDCPPEVKGCVQR